MKNSKPFVQVACLCEHVLIENDGVATLVRVVDTFNFRAAPVGESANVSDDNRPTLKLNLFVSLKSGAVIAKAQVGIQFRNDDGSPIGDLREFPIELKGGQHGHTIKADVLMPVPKAGLYWFDVLWESEAITSVPLRIVVKAPN
jgi:hypothetical protein